MHIPLSKKALSFKPLLKLQALVAQKNATPCGVALMKALSC
jgi:hypothetical protein